MAPRISRKRPAPETLPAGQSTELICVRRDWDVLKARVSSRSPVTIVRTGISRDLPVPGEVFTLEVEKSWVFGHTAYAKGDVQDPHIDIARLGLEPLGWTEYEAVLPEELGLLEEEPRGLFGEIVAAGKRAVGEMQQVLPEGVVELSWEEDPIGEAAERMRSGDFDTAHEMLSKLLEADLRCLDAHAHFGLFHWDDPWPKALDHAARHYAVGVAIGEAALPHDYRGLAPWGLLDNRPFLRCLQGLGLCRWRQERFEEGAALFRRMLWLDPSDPQGARFVLDDVEAKRPWRPDR